MHALSDMSDVRRLDWKIAEIQDDQIIYVNQNQVAHKNRSAKHAAALLLLPSLPTAATEKCVELLSCCRMTISESFLSQEIRGWNTINGSVIRISHLPVWVSINITKPNQTTSINSHILKVVDIPRHSYTPQPSLQTWRPRCTASTWIDYSANIEKLQPFSIQQDTVLYINMRNYAKNANVGAFETLAKTGDSHGFTTTLESCCQLRFSFLVHSTEFYDAIRFSSSRSLQKPCQSHSSSISLVEIRSHLPSSQLEMGLNT